MSEDTQYPSFRLLFSITWINVILHGFGLLAALFFMRPGTPLVPLESRLKYLREEALFWSLSWGLWMLCALALVAFMACLYTHLKGREAQLALIGTILTATGAVIDMTCEVIYIRVIPWLATNHPQSIDVFLAFERLASGGGVIVANGIYCLSVLLITIGLHHRLNFLGKSCGYGTFFFGMVMVGAGFLGNVKLLELTTGPTIGAFMLWTILVTRQIAKREN